MAAQPGLGREERRGKGAGGSPGGGNNVAGAAPAEFRFRTPPPRFGLGTSRRPPGAAPGVRSRPAGVACTPHPGGWAAGGCRGGRDGWPGDGPDGGTAGVGPAPTPPRWDPGAGHGVTRECKEGGRLGGGGGQPQIARAPMGGSLQAWREEARPGSSARCGAPARGGLPGAQRGVGRRPLLDPGENAGGVSAPTPCPHLLAFAKAPEGPYRGPPARYIQPASLPLAELPC